MKKYNFYLILGVIVLLISCKQSPISNTAEIDPGTYDGTWWNRTPIRLLQTNFPEVYASMDVDDYVQSMVDASATAVLFNTGGITASYQTKLPFQYKNPHMGSSDFVGDLIQKLHEKGIKYMARFDFSKVHPSIAEKKPEWLYIGANGKNLEFNNTVAACINGGYYQTYAFEILKEVIDNYDIDGIFFNMMGYTGATYDGTFYGICQCENCKKRFFEATGYKLPIDNNDPHIEDYRKFQRETANELYKKVTDFIKQQNPNLIIYNYNDVGTSWIASESGASMRPGVDNIYHATINVKRTLGTYKDKTPVNLIMGFQAIGYRNIMSSPNLLRNWWLEDMLHGAPIGFVVVGTLVHYEDRLFIPIVNELFAFHKAHEKFFTNVQAVNNVALIQGSGPEFKGMIKLLSEEHIMYDIINPDYLGAETTPRKLEEYEVVILGDVINLDTRLTTLLDNYVEKGGKLLVTGATSTLDVSNGRISLNSLGVEPEYQIFPQSQATYLKVFENDKKAFGEKEFDYFTLMMMNSRFLKCKIKEGAQGYFRLLPTNMYGPAEKTYYKEEEISEFPGAIYYNYGEGKTVYIPWLLGSEYNVKGNYAHRAVFLGSLNNLLQVETNIKTDASPMIEMTHLANRNGSFEWIGMINHSGFMGTSVREPVSIHNTNIRFKPQKQVKEIRLLRSGVSLDFKESAGWIECMVPEVGDFEMLLCTYK
ncbi:MAG: alpha-amylase family protein [Bacteroidales bacterium]